ncbi:MAG: ABC transporter substrate-binding protein [Syntrophomonadaceae bacterium]|nr:ABC transporter substrate-binding protein [Syntrophomonadaceae bacterium]
MKKFLALIAALVLVFSLAACGTDKGTNDPKEKADPEKSSAYVGQDWSSEHYKESMKGTVLNLYGVTDVVRPTLDAFEKDTGIKVEHLTMQNGEILQRLENEGKSGVSIADLWFTGGADTFINAAQKGLLLAYKSPSGEALEARMKDTEGYWHGTSLTIVNWVVNKNLIKEKGLKMPETWDDLLQPGLKDEVSMPNPASSGTAYNVVTAMLEVKGEEQGWKYLENLIGQVPYFTARGSDPANLVVQGEAIVGINASNGDRDLEINNPQVALVYPKDGTGWWPQPVAIVKGSKNEEAAKVFIDWILSQRGMENIAQERKAAVARTDVQTPEGIVDIKNIKLFATDFKANAEMRETVLAEWGKRLTAAGK